MGQCPALTAAAALVAAAAALVAAPAALSASLARCLQVPRARYLQHPPQDMLPEALLAAAAAAVFPPLSVPVPARYLVPQALCRHLHSWATCLRPDVLGHHFRADVSSPA